MLKKIEKKKTSKENRKFNLNVEFRIVARVCITKYELVKLKRCSCPISAHKIENIF